MVFMDYFGVVFGLVPAKYAPQALGAGVAAWLTLGTSVQVFRLADKASIGLMVGLGVLELLARLRLLDANSKIVIIFLSMYKF